MGSTVPDIDPGVRQRLTLRFGSEVRAWFDELPGLLIALAEKWQFELGSQIPRGSVAAVFHCRMADGRRAILKVSPDRRAGNFTSLSLVSAREFGNRKWGPNVTGLPDLSSSSLFQKRSKLPNIYLSMERRPSS